MDWNDPEARARLIARVGPKEYQRRQAEHRLRSTAANINGYPIRPVTSPRFGRIYMIDGASVGYSTRERAEAEAAKLPPNPNPGEK